MKFAGVIEVLVIDGSKLAPLTRITWTARAIIIIRVATGLATCCLKCIVICLKSKVRVDLFAAHCFQRVLASKSKIKINQIFTDKGATVRIRNDRKREVGSIID